MAYAELRDELNCSICLSLYTDPVSLRCGHNFCRLCIARALDTQVRSERYSCPECRTEYRERPALEKNRKLANIVERFLSTEPDLEKTRIFCTFCTESPVPAVKSCLHCETSMCRKHLGAHNKSVDHSLIEPTASFEHRKCSTHKEILKYYCPLDAACICVSCWVAGDHKGQDVELLDVASEKEKGKLRSVIEKLNSQRDEAERRVQNLKDHGKKQEKKSSGLTKSVNGLCTYLGKKLDDVQKSILREINRQEVEVSVSVCDLVGQVELHKEELTKEINRFEGLCNITDPLTFLKEDLKNDDISYGSCDVTVDVRDAQCLDEVTVSLILHKGLEHFVDDLKLKIQFPVMEKSDLLLDIDTAHNNIIISQDLRSASYTDTSQNRSDGPKRFKSRQVLSSCSFSSGRHYWEVDVSQAEKWLIGVVGESIERKVKGNESYICHNEKSWSLRVNNGFRACHNKIHKQLVSLSPVQAVRIYLDYEAGRLSFYELCDPIRHLHTYTASFTEPLYVGFFVFENSTIRIIK